MGRPVDRRRPARKPAASRIRAAALGAAAWTLGAAWALGAGLLAGCSFDYRPTSLDEELAEQLPDTVLRGVEHTVVRDGRIAAVLRVDRVESYDERDLVRLFGIHFTEFDGAGAVLTEAWADHAAYHVDTGDARADGSVVVESRRDDARIAADALLWRESGRTLVSGGGAEVVIERADGSRVTAAGFEADVARRVIRFLGPISGRLAAGR